MDGKIGPRCGILLSELAPDVESALDVENGPRLGTNPRSESNIYIRKFQLLEFINETAFKNMDLIWIQNLQASLKTRILTCKGHNSSTIAKT